jgi:hypothetical protein
MVDSNGKGEGVFSFMAKSGKKKNFNQSEVTISNLPKINY